MAPPALLLACLAATALASPAPSTQNWGVKSGIVGGQEAVPHQFPWQISLKYIDIWPHHYHTCGATIIDSTHIACAAHCIDGRNAAFFQVVAGAHNIKSILPEENIQKRHVSAMWKHENYDHTVITNDVSLLKLDEPLEFNEFVQPLPLAAAGDDPAGGTVCVNSGWGSISHTSAASMPAKLQYVEMPIVSRPDCIDDYADVNGVDDGMVCAGIDEGGISACSGDSGGPLACPDENGDMYLAGIVSWGMIPCGQANRPSVFTSVGFFRDWLEEHIAM